MEHFLVFAFLIIFLGGAWAALSTWQQYRTRGVDLFRSLFLYLISYNLLVFGCFFATYTQTNIIGSNPETYPPVVWIGSAVGVFTLEAGVVWAILRFGRDIRHKPASRILTVTFGVAAMLLAMSYIIGCTLMIRDGSPWWIVHTHQAMSFFMMLGISYTLIGLITGRHSNLNVSQQTSARRFGWLLLGGFLILAASLLLPVQMTLMGIAVGLLWLSFTPLLWLRRYAGPYQQLVTPEGALQAMVRLAGKHDITKREQEIMALIMEGKSNKEIADLLYISLSTVKNHIYNLFRKLEVTSRAQLMHLVMVEDAPDL
jgi:DNA-binding CsgD family transcriptional regulator